MDAHSGFPVHYSDETKEKKSEQPILSCSMRVQYAGLWAVYLFRHHPGADSARAQVRAEQHTLISVFKLNSCKLCQFKHKSQRMRARARMWEDLCMRSLEARKPAPQNARKN